MTTRKRLLAGASAVALAAGTTLAGAGLASAQGSSEIADSLGLAATALNGPVTVSGNAEGGPTVTYTNESDALQHCVGFTMPYSDVDDVGLDPSDAGDDPMALLGPILEIQNRGGVAMLTVDGDGDSTSFPATSDNGIAQAALFLIAARAGMPLEADETVTWTAVGPDEPAAAAFLCIPDAADGNDDRTAAIETAFGIDPQVVADQINGQIPGGSLEIVSADQISAGSVETGATVLGSLGDIAGGDDDDGDDTGDAAE